MNCVDAVLFRTFIVSTKPVLFSSNLYTAVVSNANGDCSASIILIFNSPEVSPFGRIAPVILSILIVKYSSSNNVSIFTFTLIGSEGIFAPNGIITSFDGSSPQTGNSGGILKSSFVTPSFSSKQ